MSDKATILGTSTMGAEPISIPAKEVVNDNQASETVVTSNGSLENVAASTTQETTETDTTQATSPTTEENESSFDLSAYDNAETKPTETTQPQQPQPYQDWKSVLKNIDRNELFKELGVSEFALKMDEHIKKGGKASDYIAAKGINWNEVPDMDLVRAEFDAKYPTLTKEQKAYKFNKMYVANDVDDEETAMDKSINLQTEAYNIRQRRIAEQQSFKEPEIAQPSINDEGYEQYKTTIANQNKSREAFKATLAEHEATKSLLQNKRVAIPIGKNGSVFNINVDKPEVLLNALTDGGKTWNKLVMNDKGEPDISKQQQIVLFAANPQKFIEDIFNYGKSMGMKAKVEEGQNATRNIGTPPKDNATNVTEKEVWATKARSSTIGSN